MLAKVCLILVALFAVASAESWVRVGHIFPNAPNIDVLFQSADPSLNPGLRRQITNLAYGSLSEYLGFEQDAYVYTIFISGTDTVLISSLVSLVVPDDSIYSYDRSGMQITLWAISDSTFAAPQIKLSFDAVGFPGLVPAEIATFSRFLHMAPGLPEITLDVTSDALVPVLGTNMLSIPVNYPADNDPNDPSSTILGSHIGLPAGEYDTVASLEGIGPVFQATATNLVGEFNTAVAFGAFPDVGFLQLEETQLDTSIERTIFLKFVNAIEPLGSVDVYLGDSASPLVSNIAFGEVTEMVTSRGRDNMVVRVTPTGQPNNVVFSEEGLFSGSGLPATLIGAPDSFSISNLRLDGATFEAGESIVRFVNTFFDSPVTVSVGGVPVKLDGTSIQRDEGVTGSLSLCSGVEYNIRVRDSNGNLVIDTFLTPAEHEITTAYLIFSFSTETWFLSTSIQATNIPRMRFLNAFTGAGPIDVVIGEGNSPGLRGASIDPQLEGANVGDLSSYFIFPVVPKESSFRIRAHASFGQLFHLNTRLYDSRVPAELGTQRTTVILDDVNNPGAATSIVVEDNTPILAYNEAALRIYHFNPSVGAVKAVIVDCDGDVREVVPLTSYGSASEYSIVHAGKYNIELRTADETVVFAMSELLIHGRSINSAFATAAGFSTNSDPSFYPSVPQKAETC